MENVYKISIRMYDKNRFSKNKDSLYRDKAKN